MTLFEFASAVAGAGIIAFHASECLLQNWHHLPDFPLPSVEASHDLHSEVGMVEEIFETGTEVVKSRFAIRCLDEAILGALAMASEAEIAPHTESRQSV